MYLLLFCLRNYILILKDILVMRENKRTLSTRVLVLIQALCLLASVCGPQGRKEGKTSSELKIVSRWTSNWY